MADNVHITFAGYPFRWPDAALVERLERFGFPRDPFPEKILPGPALQRIGFPDPLPFPEPKINQWFYPVGASRCGVYRGVMTADDLTSVKKLVWSSNTSVQASATFSIKSVVPESTKAVETSMYLLSAFPVAVDDDTDPTLYFVTLVDERYFWHQFKNGGVINALAATDTWGEVLDQLATNLGITLTYAAVSSDYGYPETDSPLYSNYENPAVLLDMVAANLGGAIVRAMDGTYSLQRWSDAVTSTVSNRLTTTGFGGEMVPSLGDEYRSVMPASVMVVFPKWLDDQELYPEAATPGKRAAFKESYGVVYTVTETLAGLGAPYSGYKNNGSTKVLHTTFRARYNNAAAGSPNNTTALNTLATKLAKDYYDARTVWIDETYRGISTLTPNGLSDFVYCFDSQTSSYTRAMAPPLNAGYHNFQHGPVQGGIDTGAVELKGLTFTSDASSQADSDPGSGKFRWDNATQSSATHLFFSNSTADGKTVTWSSFGTSGLLYLQQYDNANNWQLWKWQQVPVNGTGYYKFGGASANLALIAFGGSIDNGKVVLTKFITIPDATSTSGGQISLTAQDVGRGVKNFIDGASGAWFEADGTNCSGRLQDLSGIGVNRPDGAGIVTTNTIASLDYVTLGLFIGDTTVMAGDPRYNPIVIPLGDHLGRQAVYACFNSAGALGIGIDMTGLNSDAKFYGGVLVDAGSTPFGDGSLTVGTSAIHSGTNGDFLYDNAGVLGEYTPAAADAVLGTAAGAIADGTYP